MNIIIAGSIGVADEILRVRDALIATGHGVEIPRGVKVYEERGKVAQRQEEIAHDKIKHDLIRGYFEKIKQHGCLLVVNAEKKGVKGYVGGNTLIEMAFAFVLKKPIYLLHEIPDMLYTSEIKAMQPIVLSGDLSKLP